MGEQLCQICRTSGVRVSFDSTNTRDSFYRASVDFVLNVCRRAPTHCTSVQIDGEDAWKFVAGLAENICAAIIVSAAVAARTRSRFLQAWALEIQGKHAEAKFELSKICLMLWIFPPEESSLCRCPLKKVLAMDRKASIQKKWYLVKTLFATDECIR
ncbi:uncharacterized protein LOC136061411 [Quercus suber]|uniref:uncharacterized protein LOC136061411 n=1 Tax=Quercus suber TaxID=58331 RepID=UPI0032DF127C